MFFHGKALEGLAGFFSRSGQAVVLATGGLLPRFAVWITALNSCPELVRCAHSWLMSILIFSASKLLNRGAFYARTKLRCCASK